MEHDRVVDSSEKHQNSYCCNMKSMESTPENVGPYTIIREIGRGGMGVVYLARDTKLDRDVAIKALPEEMAADADRLIRFEREAKSLAALNHPNIAGIYGVEEQDGRKYLILEFVEGETLGERLDRGPIPVDEAIEIAIEIASGIEAAHEALVIHRDLKPDNIKITPDARVKVLDFGLAKTEEASTSTAQGDSPTIMDRHSPTIAGAILGTAAYMSPEQARGRRVDKRCDIWSFGVVLCEMLTGASPFAGESAHDSIGAILHKDVDLGFLPTGTPVAVRSLLRRCLERDKSKRLRDIGDARLELEDALRSPEEAQQVGATRRAHAVATWAIAAVLGVVAGYAGWAAWLTPTPEAAPIRVLVDVGSEGEMLGGPGPQFELSPDGSMLAFIAGKNPAMLHVRRIDQLAAQPLTGTGGAEQPFWSPDGQWIGFFQDYKLMKVSVSGGAPLTLCEAEGRARGGTWGDDGTIVFVPTTGTGLKRVSSAGGIPEDVTEPDRAKLERSHRWPHFLPGSRHVLFTSQLQTESFDESSIEVLDLETGKRTLIYHGGSYPRYTTTGYLLFGKQSTLYAAPFSTETLEMLSPPGPVLSGVSTQPSNGGVHYSVSRNGTLVYSAGETEIYTSTIEWFGRDGTRTPLEAEERGYITAGVSPDGTRLVVQLLPDGQTTFDIWMYEIERGVLSRLTFSESEEMQPVWSPDGDWIVYSWTGENFLPNLFKKRADGAGEAEPVLTSENAQFASDWTEHGNILVFAEDSADTGWDILTLDMDDEDAEPEVFIRTPFAERAASFSPDGKWLAYGSNESGAVEVYVRSFPGPGGRWQVSSGGGAHPFWSPDGSEIFYLDDDGVVSAPISVTDEALSVGKPVALFDYKRPDRFFYPQIDIMPDGERFVGVYKEDGDAAEPLTSLTFVFNWFTDLSDKAPGP
jgi:Tol biopolymer transport system component